MKPNQEKIDAFDLVVNSVKGRSKASEKGEEVSAKEKEAATTAK